jgi:hypothetical protein
MSSTRKQAAAPAAGAKGKAPVDRKPPAPIFTPLNVGIVLVIIIVAAVAFFWKSVYLAKTAEIASVNSQIQAQKTQNDVYKKKASMLGTATEINKVMDSKLKQEKKYFLNGQQDLVTFFNGWFADMLWTNGINSFKAEIEPKITFKVSWKSDPIETLPQLENAIDMFSWEYSGEGGADAAAPSTNYPDFITPMTIKLTEFNLTYEQMRRLIDNMQRNLTYFVTVHAFKNTGGDDNQYGFRTRSKYELLFTVYFMNPEGAASGDVPKGMPADKKL